MRVQFSQYTAIISLRITKRQVFAILFLFMYCELRCEFNNITKVNYGFKCLVEDGLL
jgi:hypothetical protein